MNQPDYATQPKMAGFRRRAETRHTQGDSVQLDTSKRRDVFQQAPLDVWTRARLKGTKPAWLLKMVRLLAVNLYKPFCHRTHVRPSACRATHRKRDYR